MGGNQEWGIVALAATAFEVFITADQNVEYQQNLRSATLGIVVLVAPNNRLETLRPLMPKVVLVLATIQPGDIVHITS